MRDGNLIEKGKAKTKKKTKALLNTRSRSHTQVGLFFKSGSIVVHARFFVHLLKSMCVFHIRRKEWVAAFPALRVSSSAPARAHSPSSHIHAHTALGFQCVSICSFVVMSPKCKMSNGRFPPTEIDPISLIKRLEGGLITYILYACIVSPIIKYEARPQGPRRHGSVMMLCFGSPPPKPLVALLLASTL